MIRALADEARRNPAFTVAAGIVGVYVLVGLLAPLIAPHDPNAQSLLNVLQPPSATQLLGSDEYGRDIVSRLIFGARSTMFVSVIVMLLAGLIGTTAGLVAGFWGGHIDAVLMRLFDVMMAFPSLVLALGLLAALGPGLQNVVAALTVTFIPIYARIVRSTVLAIKQDNFIKAAKTIGVDDRTIVTRHVLPNVTGTVLVQAALTFAFAVLAEAGLSFLALGVPPPAASFGNIIASGRDHIYDAPWIATSAGVATVIIVLSLLVLADGFRDAVDPYQRRR